MSPTFFSKVLSYIVAVLAHVTSTFSLVNFSERDYFLKHESLALEVV